MQSFLRNAWYAAGWTDDFGESLLSRTMCGEKIVFFRSSDGGLHALHDACPHRFVPLSLGFVRDDTVVCRYHGLEVAKDGKCKLAPGLDRKPSSSFNVNSYAVIERHRLAWVWIGDRDKADPALIPDLGWADHADWAGDGGTMHVRCNYLLLVDNLMDLTHEAYVHSSSIGQEELVGSKIDVCLEGDTVVVSRFMSRISLPPFQKEYMQKVYGYDGDVDRWQKIRFVHPSNVAIDAGVRACKSETAEEDDHRALNWMVLNAITPETESTTWYFWVSMRNFLLRDSQVTKRIQNQVRGVFEEDRDILEAQQGAVERFGEKRFANLPIDAGCNQVRALIQRRLRNQGQA